MSTVQAPRLFVIQVKRNGHWHRTNWTRGSRPVQMRSARRAMARGEQALKLCQASPFWSDQVLDLAPPDEYRIARVRPDVRTSRAGKFCRKGKQADK